MNMKKTIALLATITVPAVYFAATTSVGAIAADDAKVTAQEISSDSDRQAYFGDLHMHTMYSFDAYIFGSRVPIEDVYRFARGESVNYMGHSLKRDEPLDFIAVADHAEQLGFGTLIDDPDSAISKGPIGQRVRAGDKSAALMIEIVNGLGSGGEMKAAGVSAWTKLKEAANNFYEPGKFTTFIGYEWSSMPSGSNLHRNVIFRGSEAPFPFSALDSNRPEDLWSYLEHHRSNGIEGLAIPHNANASNGLMYDWRDSDGRPIDEVYAQRRMLNEPLNEIAQGKGQSETLPLLSGNDEFSGFEVMDQLLGKDGRYGRVEGSYARDAYGRGLEIAQRTGANPYKFGMAGGTDFHGGLSTSSESQYGGDVNYPAEMLSTEQIRKNIGLDPDPEGLWNAPIMSAGALTAVWAESNTREAIYDALRRKETFATSGTRIKVRMFAGWSFPSNLVGGNGWIRRAYADGVPMGSDMRARPKEGAAPKLALWATKDPNGANLDRVQIVKVWLEDAHRREKVYDALLSDDRKVDRVTGKASPVGNTVDLKTGKYSNSIGSTSLQGVWTDPDFNPEQPALYYVRVLEIPTPRWSTLQAIRRNLPLSDKVPATLQERAWGSPIWYMPGT